MQDLWKKPKIQHTKAVEAIERYLLATKDKGIICEPTNKSVECNSDADIAGNWNKEFGEKEPSTARLRSGFNIKMKDVHYYAVPDFNRK